MPQLSQEDMLAMLMEKAVGFSSGYVETLPKVVRGRVRALKQLQEEIDAILVEYEKEKLEILAKIEDDEIFEKRRQIISGEVEVEKKEDEEDEEEEDSNGEKGIPDFWLTAFNHSPIAEFMRDEDAEPLAKLTHVHCKSEPCGLITDCKFHFEENGFFTNKVLNIRLTAAIDVSPEKLGLKLIKSEGDVINWKEGKKLTAEVTEKTQRSKKTGKTRVVKDEKACKSFFRLFDILDLSQEKPSDPDAAEFQEELVNGLESIEYIVSRGIEAFAGTLFDEDEDEDENEEEEDYSDEDEEEDEDDDAAPADGEEKPECKQQ